MSSPIVQLVSSDQATRLRWASVLAGWELIESDSLEPKQANVQVVITDRDDAKLDGPALLVMGKPLRKQSANGMSACLPAEVDQHSLKTVCQLLAQNAALHKQLASSDQRVATLSHEAQTDVLTDLPNRRAWDQALASCREQGALPVAVALIDLDEFKPINEQAGHADGDQVLAMAARGMQRCVRNSDVLARIGGDEFGLILSDVTLVQAGVVIERIRLGIPWYFAEAREQIPPSCVEHIQPPNWISASVGYSAGAAEDVDTLLSQAAGALKNAKQSGGNQALPDDLGCHAQPDSEE